MQIDPSAKNEVLKFYQENPEQARAQFGDEPFELKNILDHWVRSTNPDFHVIPTDTVYVTIDKEAVRKSGMLLQGDSIPDRMVISLKGKSALYKGDLMMLEMIAHANWTRPIYVATTVGSENYMNLGDNFIQEGLANRITPFTTNIDGKQVEGMKSFDTEKVFDNVMHRFKFGGMSTKGVYLDETVMRMCYTHRRLISQLAINLVNEGKDAKAAQVLDLCERELPSYNIPHDYQSGSLELARSYAAIGQKAKALDIIKQLWNKSTQYMNWYCSLEGSRFTSSQRESMYHIYLMQQELQLTELIDEKLAKEMDSQLQRLAGMYQSKGGRF